MNYKLIHSKKNLNKIYKIICSQIPSSIFAYLGYNFFKTMVLKKIIYIYSIKNKSTICAVISVIDFENYKLINKKIFYFLIKNPYKLIKSLLFLLKSLKKKSNIKINKKYLHLLHLIILKKNFLNFSIKKKDMIFNQFYKKILKRHNSNIFFLCYEKKNHRAYKYYKRNNFKKFYKNNDIIFLRKFFNIK
jgi:hypothetical protein